MSDGRLDCTMTTFLTREFVVLIVFVVVMVVNGKCKVMQ